MSKKIIILATLITILFGGFLLTHPVQVQSRLREMKLLPQKENFTELYFSNYDKLVYSPVPYQGKYFSFTIHNLENQDMIYSYEVYLMADGTRKDIVGGNVFVKNGGYRSFTESFSTAYNGKKFKVVINLVNKNQTIDFWVNE